MSVHFRISLLVDFLLSKPLVNSCAPQLHYSVTWQKLKDIFRVAGSIINVEILKDREGKSRGVGEVQFETTQQALGALGTRGA